jgi:hypothetical protein
MPSPANPYPLIYQNLLQQSLDILAAFTNAGTELQTAGVTIVVQYLEIYYDGSGSIRRRWDDTRVNTLSNIEQLRLFPQLGGLFIEASKVTLYP